MTEETKTSGGEINTMLIILAVITVVGILVLAFRY
jgi:flagellar basal body-associated protein FliL